MTSALLNLQLQQSWRYLKHDGFDMYLGGGGGVTQVNAYGKFQSKHILPHSYCLYFPCESEGGGDSVSECNQFRRQGAYIHSNGYRFSLVAVDLLWDSHHKYLSSQRFLNTGGEKLHYTGSNSSSGEQ